ncbi:unnamed protein product [[Actinomadura] parvosata subsp. kistnae]|uniref:Uncharacterized protein n=1 Tax=[Actinomadura] parvosata subsp. kistnae TaxID=1909395 RepID=A0A1V0A6C2_9ACTN|nr:hypothetical protein [Nonomuraea sp. ATCC 55076]AQZ65766.1 hypothetical protein BKM31_33730 [Nonomuraea sp. ATCC 55076]SPL97177.1 unnamed protein product [Actinomadura parvosata subsp. kistnae]
MRPWARLRADLGAGKNLEIYLTAAIALVVGVLGVFDLVDTKVVGAATLATLALVAVNALGPRHQVAGLAKQVAELVRTGMPGEDFLAGGMKRFDERVAHAHDLRFAGVTLNRTMRSYVNDLRKALERGASVKVLLIDPTGSVPEEAARRSTIPDQPDVFEHRARATLYLLRDLPAREGLEVRLLPFAPAFMVFLLDPGDDDGLVHVSMSSHRSPGPAPGFTLSTRRDHVWCPYFTAEFDRLWEVARDVTDADWYPARHP